MWEGIDVEKTMDVLRDMNIGRVKEILAIMFGIDIIRERSSERLLEKLSRIAVEVLHGISFVEIIKDGKILFESGEKNGSPFDLDIGAGYMMRVYIDDLDDESLELLEYLQILSSAHISLLHEIDIDPLTGALTRRAGERKLLDLFKRRERFQMVFVDLDGLKYVNDKFGHEAGDMYLTDFVKSMSDADLVVRWGGDEFILILKENAEEFMKKASKNFWGEFSYGVVKVPDESKNLREALRIADERMYQMKRSRKRSLKMPQNSHHVE